MYGVVRAFRKETFTHLGASTHEYQPRRVSGLGHPGVNGHVARSMVKAAARGILGRTPLSCVARPRGHSRESNLRRTKTSTGESQYRVPPELGRPGLQKSARRGVVFRRPRSTR